MTKSVKIIVTVIGSLSILAGLYFAFTGSEFSSYFSSIFIGVVLVGTVYFYKKEHNTEA